MPGGRSKRNGHGGYRKPDSPAAVSPPGALSKRTDTGPSKPTLPTGQPYGSRQNLEQFQQSGPMATSQPLPGPTAGGGTPPTQPPPAATLDPFAPTQRPNEPITAGIPHGPGPNGGILPPDPMEYLRAIYAVNQNPDILEVLLDHGGQL